MTPLFGYGTFRRPAWRRAILGADYPSRPAQLAGWCRIAVGSGYLSVDLTDDADAVVHGVLIELDDAGWRAADAWEEVPKYVRVAVEVRSGDDRVTATTYVHADPRDAQPVDDDDRDALLDDAHVEAEIARFRERVR